MGARRNSDEGGRCGPREPAVLYRRDGRGQRPVRRQRARQASRWPGSDRALRARAGILPLLVHGPPPPWPGPSPPARPVQDGSARPGPVRHVRVLGPRRNRAGRTPSRSAPSAPPSPTHSLEEWDGPCGCGCTYCIKRYIYCQLDDATIPDSPAPEFLPGRPARATWPGRAGELRSCAARPSQAHTPCAYLRRRASRRAGRHRRA